MLNFAANEIGQAMRVYGGQHHAPTGGAQAAQVSNESRRIVQTLARSVPSGQTTSGPLAPPAHLEQAMLPPSRGTNHDVVPKSRLSATKRKAAESRTKTADRPLGEGAAGPSREGCSQEKTAECSSQSSPSPSTTTPSRSAAAGRTDGALDISKIEAEARSPKPNFILNFAEELYHHSHGAPRRTVNTSRQKEFAVTQERRDIAMSSLLKF